MTTYKQKSVCSLSTLFSNANYAEEIEKSNSRQYPVYLKSAISYILQICSSNSKEIPKKPFNQTSINIALSTQGLEILKACDYLTALINDWDTLSMSAIGNNPDFIEVEYIKTKYIFKSKIMEKSTNFYSSPGTKRQLQNIAERARLNYDVIGLMAQTMACKSVFDEFETTLRPTVYNMICTEIDHFEHFVKKQRIHLAVEFSEHMVYDEKDKCIYLDLK